MKGLGLRTTYFVERYDPTQTEVKTTGQCVSESHGRHLPADTKTSEQICNLSKSICTVTSTIQTGSKSIATSLWSAPTFTSHIGPAVCDNLPMAS